MKIIFIVFSFFLATTIASAQAFEGSNDQKAQLGASLQDKGAGIVLSYDLGLAEIFSAGITSTYLFGVDQFIPVGFVDRFDVKVRGNVHLGSTIGFDDNLDAYSGFSLSLKNLGFHLGARYFFSDSIGVFSEVGFPIARYKSEDRSPAEELSNQLVINLGVSFNL
ncbi:MAG: DUF6646 family protein [Maribacter sp.]